MSRLTALGLLALSAACADAARSFDVADDKFMLDGAPFQIFAGCYHYMRQPAPMWNETLGRLKAMGMNTVQFYVPWNYHEYREGEYDFSGDRDLEHFIDLIHANGMYAMVRQGPYICGEWDFGGLPGWLLAKQDLTIRTYNDAYIKEVDKWFGVLQPKLKKHLYANGGPILMVQIENEFGSYGNVQKNPSDLKYMEHLRDMTSAAFANQTLLYTTDGGNSGSMGRGSLPGGDVLTFGDHGVGSFTPSCQAQGDMNAPGRNPCMDTELYSGWLTHWGEPVANKSGADLAECIDTAAAAGHSFAMYMAFGGSNFGWWSGSNGADGTFNADLTSYDYNAPIQENTDHGYGSDGIDKFAAVREVMMKYNADMPADPAPRVRTAYGDVALTERVSMTDPKVVQLLSKGEGRVPMGALQSMEQFGQLQGYIMYSANATAGGDSLAITPYPSDRAIVFIDGERVPGAIFRSENAPLPGVKAAAGAAVDVLVEDMGHLNFGHGMTDPKGVVGATAAITLDGTALAGFSRTSFHCDDEDVAALPFAPNPDCAAADGPAFYRGTLQVDGAPTDTYINTVGWGKGMVWVNGFNVGRYWEAKGPQHALYIPGCKLRQGANAVVVLELDAAAATCGVTFTDAPDWSGQKLPKCKSAPPAGTVLSTVPCAESQLGPLQDFTMETVSGGVTVKVAGLCVTVGPSKDPSSHAPAATVEQCTGAASQVFQYDAGAKALTNGDTCLDVTANKQATLAPLEFYKCNGLANQKWTVFETPLHAHQLVSGLDQMCATACAKE